jgi:plasmid stabilization system protein ParE
MKAIWSAAAVRNLQEAIGYLQGESSAGAVTIRRRILATVRRLEQMPNSGKTGRVDGTREAVVPRSPYIVVYEVSAQEVKIQGIWHGARLWPESF